MFVVFDFFVGFVTFLIVTFRFQLWLIDDMFLSQFGTFLFVCSNINIFAIVLACRTPQCDVVDLGR